MTDHTCMHQGSCNNIMHVSAVLSPGDSIRHPAPFMWLVPKMDHQRGNWSAQMEEQQRNQKWIHGERYLTGTHMESHWLWGCWRSYHWGGSRPAARNPGGGEVWQEEMVVRKRKDDVSEGVMLAKCLTKEFLKIVHNIEAWYKWEADPDLKRNVIIVRGSCTTTVRASLFKLPLISFFNK